MRWSPGPLPATAELLEALRDAEERPARTLKWRSTINRVFRVDLLGEDVVIKTYDLLSAGQRLRYRWRTSRGRRAWAAGETFRQLGIATPQPLGWIEWPGPDGTPRSMYISRWFGEGAPARRWIKAHLHRRDPAFRSALRGELLDALVTLYDHGIYHADTKTSNLLLAHPEDPARRAWAWIDLECVRFNVRPTRRRLLRNLVQLNGSIGSKLPDDDRLAFLQALAQRYPGLDDPGLPDRLRRWTRRRLQRELDGQCGP